jgi:DNA-binding transcriptional MocR family regulator
LDETDSVINLGECHPTDSFGPDLARILKVIARSGICNNLSRYGPYGGSERHRRAGSKWFEKLGLKVDSSAVQLTCGAQHALSVIFPIVAKPKEAIATEMITYPGVKTLSGIYGFDLVGIEYDEEGMIPEALERVLKKRRIKAIYVMPTMQNPTGACMSVNRREELAQLADAHDFLIIEDDIHRLLAEEAPPLFAAIIPGKTCSVASVSKVFVGGLRVAFLVAPESLRSGLQMAIQASIVAAPQLPFEIFSTWLEEGTVDEILANRRKQALKRQQLAQKYLRKFGISCHESSPFVWLELPDEWPAHEFTVQALKARVAVNSPDAFVVRPADIPNRVRICLSVPDTITQVDAGLKILENLISKRPYTPGVTM